MVVSQPGSWRDAVMANLWIRDEASEWLVLPLRDEWLDLDSIRGLADRRTRGAESPPAALLGAPGPADEGWVVLSEPGRRIRINGQALDSGIRVLQDRDELGVESLGSVYFSAETLARVEPFPAFDRRITCPRCVQPIREGDLAVRCPRCGVWHHQSDEYPCWDYSEKCAACGDQDTDLEAGYRWSPEEL